MTDKSYLSEVMSERYNIHKSTSASIRCKTDEVQRSLRATEKQAMIQTMNYTETPHFTISPLNYVVLRKNGAKNTKSSSTRSTVPNIFKI